MKNTFSKAPKANLIAKVMLVVVIFTASGCASLPPLNDASVVDVSLATQEDVAIYNRAKSEHYQLSGIPIPDTEENLSERVPTLKISFSTSRKLVGPDDRITYKPVLLDTCDDSDEFSVVGPYTDVMWQGQILGTNVAQEIEAQSVNGRAMQTYVVLSSYWYRGPIVDLAVAGPLLPSPGDLCLSFVEIVMIAPTRKGKPLRIDKDVVNRVIAPVLAAQPAQTQQ